jgi:hypothetical protein
VSDLQCAVTVHVVPAGSPAPASRYAATYDVHDRLWERLDEIADLHRGETVLVVADEGLIEAAWGSTGRVELAGDADGWVRRRDGAT